MKRVPSIAEDLSGRRLGRLTVQGLLDQSAAPVERRAKWVVRCTCGMYETRSAKAIKAAKDPNDACINCRTVADRRREQKRAAFFDRHGRWPPNNR